MPNTGICAVCTRPFPMSRAGRTTCSTRCRQVKSRQTRKPTLFTAVEMEPPAPPAELVKTPNAKQKGRKPPKKAPKKARPKARKKVRSAV